MYTPPSFLIYALTETCLSPSYLNGEILPTDFAVYRSGRSSRGGGVLVAVNSLLPSHRLPSPFHLELILVEIELVTPLLICVVYIPPNASSDYCLHILHFFFESISSKSPCIIVGDFDSPDINRSTLVEQSPSSVAFCDLIFRLNLTQLVDFPTHSSGNTLDLVISDSTELIQNLFSFSSNLLQSDHFTITFSVSVHNSKKKKPKHPPSYNFKRTALNALSDFLLDCNFNLLMESTNIEFVWSSLKNLILETILHSTPITRARRSPYPKWFDSNIRHKINKLRSLRKFCRRKPCPHNLLKLSFEEIQLQDNISLAKSEFENNLVY